MKQNQKIWTCTKFTGHYPVGVSAIVIADSAEEAAATLNKELVSLSLPGDAEPSGMIEYDGIDEAVRVLNNGDY